MNALIEINAHYKHKFNVVEDVILVTNVTEGERYYNYCYVVRGISLFLSLLV